MFIVGIVGLRLYDRNTLLSNGICFVGCCAAAIGGVFLFISLVIIIDSHIDIDKQIQEARMERESIERQLHCISGDYYNGA